MIRAAVVVRRVASLGSKGERQVSNAGRRALLVSKVWVQTAVLVILVGFTIMGLLTYSNYMQHPPVPRQVLAPGGQTLFTGKDISRGQQVFLHNGLMEYGSAFGHGAYLGPDYTADYLRRESVFVGRRYGDPRRTIADFRTNRYEARSGRLTVSAAQAAAFRALVPY